ncbi:hypothetical protein D3C85_930680 [compost metagenome]
MLTQRLGHDPETPGQLVEFHGRGNRQGDVEVALANVVRRLRQGLDGLAETPGDGMRSDETDDQNRQPDQAEQSGNQ